MAGLHIVEDGSKDAGAGTVVLVHGTLDRGATFGRTARFLGAAGYRVLRYDRRGYGRSIDVGPGGIDDHHADLISVLDGRPAIVVGHSFGGVVALVAAEKEPSLVRSVLAFEAPMPWADWWPRHTAGSVALHADPSSQPDPEDAAERFMRRMVGDDRWQRLPLSTRAARRAEGVAMIAELASLRDGTGPPYRAASIGCPVLAACGSESADHHRRAAEELAQHVPGARLVVVEGSQHGVHLTHPLELAALVEDLAGETAGGR